MDNGESRVMNSDEEDKSRQAEYITVQMMISVGEKVEDCFWDSKTPDF